jgi:RNA polymerase sigma factor (sigma-70 family)
MNHLPAAAPRTRHSASTPEAPVGAPSRWDIMVPHVPRLLRLARRRLPTLQDAEDCVQEALIRTACAINLDQARVGPFLTTVVINLCADQARARSARARLLDRVAYATTDPPPEESICDRAEARWLSDRVEHVLPVRERDVLRARAAGLTVRQTAEHLGMTVKAAEAAFTRARKVLRGHCAGAVTQGRSGPPGPDRQSRRHPGGRRPSP